MKPATEFRPAERLHHSALASVEKRILIWLANRMPKWVNSDHLTILGFLSLIAVGLSYWYARYSRAGLIMVMVFFAMNWFGDSLDGTLARVRNRQRPRYGFYVDHVIDLAGTTCLLAGMAASGRMSPLVAAAVLVGYLLVSAESYLATHATGVFRISFLGFGPTELRILLSVGAIWMVTTPWITIGDMPIRPFDLGGAIAAASLAAVFVASSLRNVRALYVAERLPQ